MLSTECNIKQQYNMKQDWDIRACLDVISFTSPNMEWRELPEYFEHGRQQAHYLTRDSFRGLSFDPAGKRMLEIGCGIGRLFPGFTEMFSEVWGVDVSEEMIRRGRKLNTSPKVKYLQNNGYDLTDIPDNSMDFILSYNTMQSVPEKWMVYRYFEEIFRALKPGGIFQLHFRTNKLSFRSYIYWHLPDLLRRPAQIIYRLITLHPLQRHPFNTPHIPGNKLTWYGTSFNPEEITQKLAKTGFAELKNIPDDMYPEGMKFWVIGRKPES